MKITVERFKSVTRVELPIAPLTLLVGGNNSGKSSLLQAIQFAVSAAQTTSTQFAYWNENKLSTSVSPADLFYSPLRDVYALAPNGRLKENPNEAIRVSIQYNENECTVQVRKGRNKNIQIGLNGESLGRELQNLNNPFSIIVPGLAGIPAYEEYETPLVIRKAAARGDSNSVFRNILWLLKQGKQSWVEFSDRLATIFSGLTINIDFNPESNEYIECYVVYGGNTLPIDSCGTGVLQAIQILSYASLYRPKLLILDEPDSHLHPNNQRKLSQILTELSSTGIRILISTHSLHLVDSLLDNATVHWLRNGTLVEDADNYELKALIDIGALSEGDELRNAQVVILAEDEKKGLLEDLLLSSGFDLEECELWSYKGCSNVNTAKTLICYIRKHNPTCSIIIHRDRDCLTDEELNTYKEAFSGNRLYVFVPDFCDLEGYFCTANHIHAIYPNLAMEIIETAIANVLRGRNDKLLEKMINSRIEHLKKNGENINAGEIAVYCRHSLNEAPLLYANGKILLAGLNDELRTMLGHNANLKTQSPMIICNPLTGIKQEIDRG